MRLNYRHANTKMLFVFSTMLTFPPNSARAMAGESAGILARREGMSDQTSVILFTAIKWQLEKSQFYDIYSIKQ